MKAAVYASIKEMGKADLQLTDETIGVVEGQFVPHENYQKIRTTIWKFHSPDNSKIKNYGIPKERLLEPWEFITTEQKIAYK